MLSMTLLDEKCVCSVLNETIAGIFEFYYDFSFRSRLNMLLNTRIDLIRTIFESQIINYTISSVHSDSSLNLGVSFVG